MSNIPTEYRTQFDMETDNGEGFDVLEQWARSLTSRLSSSDDDPFETETMGSISK
jgi:hypothetical protein